MNHSEKISELTKALIEAEGKFKEIKLNKTAKAGSFSFKYADLTSIFNATKPALREHGLKCVGYFGKDEGGVPILTLMLTHISGEWMKTSISISPQTSKPTDLGGFITYMRRYLYTTLLGVCAEEDVEGDDLNKGCDNKSNSLTPQEKAWLKKELKNHVELEEAWKKHFKIESMMDLDRKNFQKLKNAIEERNKTSEEEKDGYRRMA